MLLSSECQSLFDVGVMAYLVDGVMVYVFDVTDVTLIITSIFSIHNVVIVT